MVLTQVVAHCPKCRTAIEAAQSESWCIGCGTPLGEDVASLLPAVVAQRSAVAFELGNARPALIESRGDRLFRGMVGMGTIFAAVGGVLISTLAVTSLILGFDRDDVDFMIVATIGWTAIAFALGMIYAGLLAIVARGRSFSEVSTWRAALSGAVTGLAPAAVVLASDLIKGHSVRDVLEPLMLFPPLSAAVAVITLLIARRAKSAA